MNGQVFSRRGFMTRTIAGIFAFIGAAVAVPLAGFGILPAVRKKESEWSDTGPERDLAVNEPRERRFFQVVRTGWQEEKTERTVWIVKHPGGGVTAFAPSCPHLGCGYRWFESERRFKCPCHASVFDIEGNVLSGPAPRPLDTLEVKIEGGRVLVKFETFQVGTGKKTTA